MKKHSSPKLSSEAARILHDESAAPIARELAGSVLSTSEKDKHASEQMGSIASEILNTEELFDEKTKSLAGSVLAQQEKDKKHHK